MKSNQVILVIIILGIFYSVVSSCKYDEILPFEPDPGVVVKFNADIIPIFNANCSISGCHNGSGHVPDLRSSVAYDELWGGGYINIQVPEQSELYLWMTGTERLSMPPGIPNATNNAKVLQWIEQGALNN